MPTETMSTPRHPRPHSSITSAVLLISIMFLLSVLLSVFLLGVNVFLKRSSSAILPYFLCSSTTISTTLSEACENDVAAFFSPFSVFIVTNFMILVTIRRKKVSIDSSSPSSSSSHSFDFPMVSNDTSPAACLFEYAAESFDQYLGYEGPSSFHILSVDTVDHDLRHCRHCNGNCSRKMHIFGDSFYDGDKFVYVPNERRLEFNSSSPSPTTKNHRKPSIPQPQREKNTAKSISINSPITKHPEERSQRDDSTNTKTTFVLRETFSSDYPCPPGQKLNMDLSGAVPLGCGRNPVKHRATSSHEKGVKDRRCICVQQLREKKSASFEIEDLEVIANQGNADSSCSESCMSRTATKAFSNDVGDFSKNLSVRPCVLLKPSVSKFSKAKEAQSSDDHLYSAKGAIRHERCNSASVNTSDLTLDSCQQKIHICRSRSTKSDSSIGYGTTIMNMSTHNTTADANEKDMEHYSYFNSNAMQLQRSQSSKESTTFKNQNASYFSDENMPHSFCRELEMLSNFDANKRFSNFISHRLSLMKKEQGAHSTLG
ncbi:hypothetical protein KP509_04G021600 [Ceratopteris richardii]|uniref:Uncharacterized protein n=1 Tax=Ceratopteris richardii TaxID=49495 RepID=A0A8T2UQT1_CERRI|nr:hypothetical protein KP509_04G021600 [Ceratopteris richardii]